MAGCSLFAFDPNEPHFHTLKEGYIDKTNSTPDSYLERVRGSNELIKVTINFSGLASASFQAQMHVPTLIFLTKFPANNSGSTVAPASSVNEVPCTIVFHLHYSLLSTIHVATVAIQSDTRRVVAGRSMVCKK